MAVEIVNMRTETLPPLRLIGKRCLCGPEAFGAKWSEWHKSGWFEQLRALGVAPENGAEYLGVTQPDSWHYWIGLLFPLNKPVPEGFVSAEIPTATYAVFEFSGKKPGELFGEEGIKLCLKAASQHGLSTRQDGWGIERYSCLAEFGEKRNMLFEFMLAIDQDPSPY